MDSRSTSVASSAAAGGQRSASVDTLSDADSQQRSSQSLAFFLNQSDSQPSSPAHRSEFHSETSSQHSPRYSSDFSPASSPNNAATPRLRTRVSFVSDDPQSTSSFRAGSVVLTDLIVTPTASVATSRPQHRPPDQPNVPSIAGAWKSESVFDRLSRNPPRTRTSPHGVQPPPLTASDEAAASKSARPLSRGKARFRLDPRLATPKLEDATSLWELVLLAQRTAQLVELGSCQLGAIVALLEALCFVHHFDDARANPVKSAEQHLGDFATVRHLRQLFGPNSPQRAPLDLTVAFSVVNWLALADVLETVETEPPLSSLAFLSKWLPASLGLDPLYEVHQLLHKLKRHVVLIRGDCLHRCLLASLSSPLRGRIFPPLYEVSPESRCHRSLAHELLRLLRASDSSEKFRAWCLNADRSTLQAAELAKAQAQAKKMQLPSAQAREESGALQFEEWLSAKDKARSAEAKKKAEEKATERAKLEKREALRREWHSLRKAHKPKARPHKELPKTPTECAGERAARLEEMQQEAACAYGEWLWKATSKRLEEEWKKHQQALQEREDVKRRFHQSQRAFKQWLKQKRCTPKQPADRPRRGPAWLTPTAGHGCLLLEEQQGDYFY